MAKKKGVNPYRKPEKKKKAPSWIVWAALALAVALGVGGFAYARVSAAREAKKTYAIEIEVRDYGTIRAELYGAVAPKTVENFVKLARAGFYDGLTFHRVISGFMIQGGDPKGDGTGGAPDTIPGEFALNGFVNTLSHTRGVISMARASGYNTASSQFFIMHADTPSLDGSYAAFGRVTEGMEIVDAICADTPAGENGMVEAENQPVITAVRVVEP